MTTVGIKLKDRTKRNQRLKIAMALFSLFIVVSVANLYAEPSASLTTTYQLVLKPGSKVWITGDSTLHPYSSTATVVDLSADFSQPPNGSGTWVERLSQSDVMAFKVTIPVESLKSGEKGLDKNMYKALKAKDYPSIEFRLTDKRLLLNSSEGANPLASNGVLSIAGKENAVQINYQSESTPEGIRIFGTKPLRMSDYGVKPPTMLGVIKVRDDVAVHFDLVLGSGGGKN